jgi:hypothetical protein
MHTQYANFRDNIPYLITFLILHPSFRKLYGAFWRIDNYKFLDGSNTGLSHDPSPLTVADARLQHRTLFDFTFGIIFLIALHGVSAAKVLLIFYTNFNIATRLPEATCLSPPGSSMLVSCLRTNFATDIPLLWLLGSYYQILRLRKMLAQK